MRLRAGFRLWALGFGRKSKTKANLKCLGQDTSALTPALSPRENRRQVRADTTIPVKAAGAARVSALRASQIIAGAGSWGFAPGYHILGFQPGGGRTGMAAGAGGIKNLRFQDLKLECESERRFLGCFEDFQEAVKIEFWG
jgi:hypothetical protein